MTSFYELKINHLKRIQLSTCQTQYIAATLSFPTLRCCSFCAGDAGNWGSIDVAAGNLYQGGSWRILCWWKLKVTQLLLLETAEIQRICLAYHIPWDDCPYTHTHTHIHTPRFWKMSIYFRALGIILYYRALTVVYYTYDCQVYGSSHRLPLQKYKNI